MEGEEQSKAQEGSEETGRAKNKKNAIHITLSLYKAVDRRL